MKNSAFHMDSGFAGNILLFLATLSNHVIPGLQINSGVAANQTSKCIARIGCWCGAACALTDIHWLPVSLSACFLLRMLSHIDSGNSERSPHSQIELAVGGLAAMALRATTDPVPLASSPLQTLLTALMCWSADACAMVLIQMQDTRPCVHQSSSCTKPDHGQCQGPRHLHEQWIRS
jgi:hypothetical protein